MNLEDTVKAYLRELSNHRNLFAASFFIVAGLSLLLALSWPKSYTSWATIYGDNSNILQPLMEGNAVATGIGNQAQMAQEILFKREFTDEVLAAGGWNPSAMSAAQKEDLIRDVQGNTEITNVGRNPASLIRIAYTDGDPIRAFALAQKYTSLFIEESVVEKRAESRNAFEFIQNQVASYQQKLKQSEERLSEFKSENNFGTLADANGRLSRYRNEIERLELDLVQLNTEEDSVEEQLAGQREVSRDLSEINALRSRINSLQIQLDSLRAHYHDSYPDIVNLKNQITDLVAMMESGRADGMILDSEPLDQQEGVTPLHQQLRSQLAAIRTSIQSKTSQLEGIRALLAQEEQRVTMINESDAVLAELTRDYNVTRDFYNDMLKRLENARVSMQLDEQQQGITFKVQESAVIPSRPDGLSFAELLAGSFILSFAVPCGLLLLYMELDPRIRSESAWKEGWPPLLMTVPPLRLAKIGKGVGNSWYLAGFLLLSLMLYAGVAVLGLLRD